MANHEEESEFDRDDEEHDHANCGHTPEQHAKMNGRLERLQTNMKKFLADNAEDMLEDGQYTNLKTKVEKRLRRNGHTPSLTALKLFLEGFEFGMSVHINVPHQFPPVLAAISKMVIDKEKKTPKMDIDITKSQPLPPKTDEPPQAQ